MFRGASIIAAILVATWVACVPLHTLSAYIPMPMSSHGMHESSTCDVAGSYAHFQTMTGVVQTLFLLLALALSSVFIGRNALIVPRLKTWGTSRVGIGKIRDLVWWLSLHTTSPPVLV